MRLVFSNYDDLQNPWYGGGGARAIHEVARRLAARHEVTVVTGRYPGCQHVQRDGVRYVRIGLARPGPRLAQLSFALLLPRQVRRLEFDLWIESLTPPFSTACLPWFTSQPVIALTQVLAGEGMGRKYHLPFAAFERRGLRTYHWAVAVSPYLKQRLLAANPGLRIAVIPNGTDRAAIEREVHPAPEHLLFLGRIDVEQKGLDLLLDSFARLADKVKAPLIIAGGGPKRDTALVARRVGDLGLGRRVRLVGRVGGEDKTDLLRRAICLLLPSRFEASPLVVVEAFCHRVPVVLFNIPELSWLPEDCCSKVPPFDTAAFAQAVADLVGAPDRQRAMGQAAKAHARHYDWDDLARRYEEFFETVRQRQ